MLVRAVGEARGCDGASLLDAYIVGLEAMGRVGEAVNYEHYERGWHATSTLAPIGAGAACGRLLGLDTEQIRACMSLAFSLAGGSKRPPRPRTHLVRYHGVFAPNARHRALLLATPRPPEMCAQEESKAAPSRAAMTWMQRLRRVFDIDISICPRCGGALKVLVVISEPAVIAAILAHLARREARAPPMVA